MDTLARQPGAPAPRRQIIRGLGALALGELGIVGASSRAMAGCHHGVCA